MTRRWLVRLALLMALIGLLASVFLATRHRTDIANLEAWAGGASSRMSLLRICVIGALIVAWPSLVRGCCKHRWLTPARATELVALRWRVAAWLVALELLIGFDAANRLIGLISPRLV